jgi:hypothetical protein
MTARSFRCCQLSDTDIALPDAGRLVTNIVRVVKSMQLKVAPVVPAPVAPAQLEDEDLDPALLRMAADERQKEAAFQKLYPISIIQKVEQSRLSKK